MGVKETLINAFAKVKFETVKNSPKIFMVVGAISVISGTVLACKKTLELDKIKKETESKAEEIKKYHEQHPLVYTEDKMKHDLTIVRATGVIKTVKNYVVPGLLIIGGLASFGKSYNILNKWNIGLGSALAAKDKAFKEYRKRNIEAIGEEKEKLIYNNFKKGIEEVEEINEEGVKEKKKKTINIGGDTGGSEYRRYFGPGNPSFDNNCNSVYYIENFLRMQQNILNDRLNRNGFVTLNEVYEALNFKIRPDNGMVCGWKKDSKNGDGYIQFDVERVKIPDETGKLTEMYAIDFNCEGYIYNEAQNNNFVITN